MKNIFPCDLEEKELVKFIGRYQSLSINDEKYFFDSDSYYKKRISRLIKNEILRRYNGLLVLAENGIKYINASNYTYNPFNYEKKHRKRANYITHIAAIYNKEKNIEFKPSFEIKEKELYTQLSRRYIGLLKIKGFQYLVYRIEPDSTTKYINSIVFDIEKENKVNNFIILVPDMKKIDISKFELAKNSILILEDNEENLEQLKYLHSIDWQKAVDNIYRNKVFISEYNNCDYTNKRQLFVNCFYFLDTEKINRIKNFLSNNNKSVDIVCNKILYEYLSSLFPDFKYRIIDLEKFIDKEITYYD